MSTRAIARTATGGTNALELTDIGAIIEMPAGGPHLIHSLWGQVAKVTTAADEGTGGDLILTSLSGDITPQPAPAVFPLIGSPANPSANEGISAVALNIWPVAYNASGKATLQLSYRQELAIANGSQLSAGIIFGDSRPEVKPILFTQVVRASFASATEQTIGEIQLSEKATKITGIMAVLNKGDASTVAEAVMATVRLASDDIQFPPSTYPCNVCFDAAVGTPVGPSAVSHSFWIPLDIDVEGGARVNVFATTTESVTGNADISVYIAYE